MAEHFGVKEAAAVLDALSGKNNDGSMKPRPWDIYKLLGSYAFAA
jgi:hypothetical protein